METYNIHVPGLYHLINKIIMEFEYCQSANSTVNSEHDIVRGKTFVEAIRAHIGNIGQPMSLDLPENDPHTYPLREMAAPKDIENSSFSFLALLLRAGNNELVRSQSARSSSGLNKFDRARLLSICTEAENTLNNIMQQVDPLDLVESTPRAEIQGPGRNT